ncbi:MAG: DUF11 domain-containing protein [Clostridia bacterium]|nr:DUF11 domain-containing protein [Clostridia bacterium]
MATTFYNTAALSYNGVTTRSNTVSGEIAETLTVTKTALTDVYTAGSEVTFVLNFVNAGTAAAGDLTVTDDLGAYAVESGLATPLTYVDGSARYFVGGVPQAAPAVTAGPPLVFTGISVPAGGNAAIVYTAAVNEFAPPGEDGSITNAATVTGDAVAAPVTASETISAANEPLLTVTKAVNPANVAPNGELTYTFTVANSGNTAADATDNVTLSDVFTPQLSGLAVELDGSPLSVGSGYTYAGGSFQTVPGVITVPAGSFEQDPATGAWTTTPSTAVLTVTGTV